MRKEHSIKDWERMHKELTDPEKLEEARQKAEREKRIEERKSDTGYE